MLLSELISAEVQKKGYSITYGVASQKSSVNIEELVAIADKCMLENKRKYYMASGHDRRKIRD